MQNEILEKLSRLKELGEKHKRNYSDMKVQEVDFSQHVEMIKRAEDGHVDSARMLMADASVLLQHGLPLYGPLGHYIGEALYKSALVNISGAKVISKAFHLNTGKRSRNPYKERMKKHLICMEVQLAFLSVGHYEASHGKGAYEMVAEIYGYKDPGSVKKIFTSNHSTWHVKEKTADELSAMLEGQRYWYGHT